MASTTHVRIVTPERRVFDGPATEIILPAWDGELGVYPNHDALLALLRSGTCRVQTPDGAQRWVLGRGFAEIGGDSVTVLTSSCVPVGEVDRDKAKADLAAAEAEAASAEYGSERSRQAQIRIENARARVTA